MPESQSDNTDTVESSQEQPDMGTHEGTETELDWKAEAERWKSLSRKHEKQAKENSSKAKELETLRQSSLTEQERAVADAEARGRQAARAEYVEQLAAAKLEAALTGLVDDPSEIVSDLNISKYVDDDGQVDEDAVSALKARYAKLAGSKTNGSRVGHGRSAAPSSASPAEQFAQTIEGLFQQ